MTDRNTTQDGSTCGPAAVSVGTTCPAETHHMQPSPAALLQPHLTDAPHSNGSCPHQRGIIHAAGCRLIIDIACSLGFRVWAPNPGIIVHGWQPRQMCLDFVCRCCRHTRLQNPATRCRAVVHMGHNKLMTPVNADTRPGAPKPSPGKLDAAVLQCACTCAPRHIPQRDDQHLPNTDNKTRIPQHLWVPPKWAGSAGPHANQASSGRVDC